MVHFLSLKHEGSDNKLLVDYPYAGLLSLGGGARGFEYLGYQTKYFGVSNLTILLSG